MDSSESPPFIDDSNTYYSLDSSSSPLSTSYLSSSPRLLPSHHSLDPIDDICSSRWPASPPVTPDKPPMSPLFQEFSFARPRRSSASLDRERKASTSPMTLHAPPSSLTPPSTTLDSTITSSPLLHQLPSPLFPPSPISPLEQQLQQPPRQNLDFVSDVGQLAAHMSAQTLEPSPSPPTRPYSPNFVRRQRQKNIRLQCDDTHLRRIAELVDSMVQRGEACCVSEGGAADHLAPKSLVAARPGSPSCVKKKQQQQQQARIRRKVSWCHSG